MLEHKPEELQELRRKAEARLKTHTKVVEGMSPSEIARLLHELQVHQVELEIQNEELRRAQAELERSRSRYSDLYDFAPVGYLVLDRNGLILEVNLTGAKLLGLERSRLMKKPVYVYAHEDDRDDLRRHLVRIFTGRQRQSCEVRLCRSNGTEFFARFEGLAVIDESSGGVHCRVAVSDITDRKEVQKALAQSESRYRSFVDNALVGVYQTNVAGDVLYVNKALADIFEFSGPEEMIALGSLARYKDPEDRQRFLKVLSQTKHVTNYEVKALTRSGEIKWVIISAFLEGSEISCMVVDVTDRKNADEDMKASHHQLEELVDARTAELTRSNEELLAEIEERKRLEKAILEVSDREQRRLGRELHDSVGQQFTGVSFLVKAIERKFEAGSIQASDFAEVTRLVNEGLNQARILAHGMQPVLLEERDLANSLQELTDRTKELFHINCTFECEKPFTIGDASVHLHLYRICQEAITNAVKHGGARNIHVNLCNGAGESVLKIESDGEDFPKEFEARGTGMGLRIMDQRADIIGGTLSIHKGPGGGTVVTCKLPNEGT